MTRATSVCSLSIRIESKSQLRLGLLTFDAGHGEELHIRLQLLDAASDLLFSVCEGCFRGQVGLVPLVEVRLRDELLGDDEGPETVKRQVFARFIYRRPLSWPDFGLHDDLRTLQVEDDLAGLFVLEDDAHALGV